MQLEGAPLEIIINLTINLFFIFQNILIANITISTRTLATKANSPCVNGQRTSIERGGCTRLKLVH